MTPDLGALYPDMAQASLPPLPAPAPAPAPDPAPATAPESAVHASAAEIYSRLYSEWEAQANAPDGETEAEVESAEEVGPPVIDITPEAIVAGIPPEIAKARDQWDRQDAQHEHGHILEDMFVTDVIAPEVSAAVTRELREIMGDLNLNRTESATILDAARTHDMNAEPDWGAVVEVMNRTFGQKASAAMKFAQQAVSRDPRVAAMLNATALGNNPRVIASIARAAMRS